MSGPTNRGPKYVRRALREHLLAVLPPLVPYLQQEWGDSGAFPPAGPDEDAKPIPSSPEFVQTSMGRPMDRWPLVQVELETSTSRRASIETTEGSDTIAYFTTYVLTAMVWIDVDLPESVETDEEREYVTDVRDDLQMALRYALLDRMSVNDDPDLTVLAGTYSEEYGEPQAAGGQRWSVAGRAHLSLRAQERLSRPSLATVTPDAPEIDFGVTVHPVPVDHPALQ